MKGFVALLTIALLAAGCGVKSQGYPELENCSVVAISGSDTIRVAGVRVTFLPTVTLLYKELPGGEAKWSLPLDSLDQLSLRYAKLPQSKEK